MWLHAKKNGSKRPPMPKKQSVTAPNASLQSQPVLTATLGASEDFLNDPTFSCSETVQEKQRQGPQQRHGVARWRCCVASLSGAAGAEASSALVHCSAKPMQASMSRWKQRLLGRQQQAHSSKQQDQQGQPSVDFLVFRKCNGTVSPVGSQSGTTQAPPPKS